MFSTTQASSYVILGPRSDPRRVDPTRFTQVITEAGFRVASSNPTRGALTTPAPPNDAQRPLTELSADLEPLHVDFNRDASSTRLLLILSPS